MAAETAARAGAAATIYEAMPTAGRKFLMAGRSGLNITNAEDFDAFVARYDAAADWIRPILEDFAPPDLRDFCAALGVGTFVGSSGRVFPGGMKASPLLRAWLARLAEQGVSLRTRVRLVAFAEDGAPVVERADGTRERIEADATVLALGGASWPRLGSTGDWARLLAARGVALAPFHPSNCGVEIAWSRPFVGKFEGQAIKNARFSHGGRSVAGEAVVTRRGLEGGPVYALSSGIGEALRSGAEATLRIDLKPDIDAKALAARLARRRAGDSIANSLRKTLGLAPVAIGLLREANASIAAMEPRSLAELAKACPVQVRAVSGLDRAISTAGGVRLEEVDRTLMIRKAPGLFVAGEMLDWDAPTGGYLLQACFATGKRAGESAAAFALRRTGASSGSAVQSAGPGS